ncbi:hypothetical protein ACJIZ3_011960 [Penstemon smallii]|uniref:Uncharacterized protein n=1 Tax=Penstemon smallii TaxID=265156 RepID=A0ABD3UNT6_9LAMI
MKMEGFWTFCSFYKGCWLQSELGERCLSKCHKQTHSMDGAMISQPEIVYWSSNKTDGFGLPYSLFIGERAPRFPLVPTVTPGIATALLPTNPPFFTTIFPYLTLPPSPS